MERLETRLDGPAIIKPLAGFGGQNVFYVARGQTANLQQMISTVRRDGYVIGEPPMEWSGVRRKRTDILTVFHA